jgi:hypothetical protein
MTSRWAADSIAELAIVQCFALSARVVRPQPTKLIRQLRVAFGRADSTRKNKELD